jgi:large subunit ribosomal protein L30
MIWSGETMGNVLELTLKKSNIGSPQKIRATLIGLGLTRMNKKVVRQNTPEIRGMLRKVQHLVEVKE